MLSKLTFMAHSGFNKVKFGVRIDYMVFVPGSSALFPRRASKSKTLAVLFY